MKIWEWWMAVGLGVPAACGLLWIWIEMMRGPFRDKD